MIMRERAVKVNIWIFIVAGGFTTNNGVKGSVNEMLLNGIYVKIPYTVCLCSRVCV